MRKKTQVTNQFEVDTEGSCFLCFKEIPRPRPLRKSTRGHSTDDSDTDEDNEDGGHGGVSTADKRRRRVSGRDCRSLSSLQKLSRYLHLNMQKVFNGETTTSIPAQLLPTLQRSELKVSLCGDCGHVIDKFEVTLVELQKIQLQIGYCMKTVLGKLVMAEGEEAKEDHWNRIRDSPQAVMHIGIVENLRKEAIEKCSSKVAIFYPKVQIEPLSEVCLVELGRKSEPVKKKSCDPPISPARKDDQCESEDEGRDSTDSEGDDDDYILPQPKRKAPRVRRVIRSASSSSASSLSASSSSESDDESVELEQLVELRSTASSKRSSLSETRKNLNSSLFNRLHSSSTRRNSEKSIDSSLADQSVVSIPEGSSRAKVGDDPVKRLYPFKCQTCRKRFRTEDKLNSHDHPISSEVPSEDSISVCPSPPKESETLNQPMEVPVGDLSLNMCSTPMDSEEVIEVIDVIEESMEEDEHEKLSDQLASKVIPKSKKKQSAKASTRPKRKCALNSANKGRAANSSQQSRIQENLKRKLATNDKNGVGATYKLKCSYCSVRFKLEKDLANHVGLKHADELPNGGDTSIQPPQNEPSVPIVKAEDDFKIEYVLPNNDEDIEDTKVVTVTEEVDLDISDTTNQFIDDLLQIPSPLTSTGSEDAGSSPDDENLVELIKEDKVFKVESKSVEGGWMSIGAKFRMDTADGELEGDPPNLAEKIEQCIMNDEIKKECLAMVPMITDDVEDEIVEINHTVATSPALLPMCVIDCVQSTRES